MIEFVSWHIGCQYNVVVWHCIHIRRHISKVDTTSINNVVLMLQSWVVSLSISGPTHFDKEGQILSILDVNTTSQFDVVSTSGDVYPTLNLIQHQLTIMSHWLINHTLFYI